MAYKKNLNKEEEGKLFAGILTTLNNSDKPLPHNKLSVTVIEEFLKLKNKGDKKREYVLDKFIEQRFIYLAKFEFILGVSCGKGYVECMAPNKKVIDEHGLWYYQLTKKGKKIINDANKLIKDYLK